MNIFRTTCLNVISIVATCVILMTKWGLVFDELSVVFLDLLTQTSSFKF